jgi:hypothetical protein
MLMSGEPYSYSLSITHQCDSAKNLRRVVFDLLSSDDGLSAEYVPDLIYDLDAFLDLLDTLQEHSTPAVS